jgi:anti-sigma B factor antagonist
MTGTTVGFDGPPGRRRGARSSTSRDVTPASEAALMEAYARRAGRRRAVVLDFTGLDYMNSGGIGLLVTLLVRAQRREAAAARLRSVRHYRQIFELTRLDDAIAIHDDEDAAPRRPRSSCSSGPRTP